MVFRDWHEPVRLLAETYATPTVEQRALAEFAHVDLVPATPRVVAAAMLRRALSEPLWRRRSTTAATRRQIDYLAQLRTDEPAVPVDLDRETMSAWIAALEAKRRVAALRRLQPVAGDLVIGPCQDFFWLRPVHRPEPVRFDAFVVSSVSDNGRVNFRGGPHRHAWPDQVEMSVRRWDHWVPHEEQGRFF